MRRDRVPTRVVVVQGAGPAPGHETETILMRAANSMANADGGSPDSSQD